MRQVNAIGLFELFRKVVHDAHVKVFTTEERVAIGGFHFEQAVVDLKNGHVECTAAKVIDRDGLRILFVEAVGQRGGCRLVDDAQHFETGDLAGIFGGLTLGVVEVGRHGDNRLRDFLAQIAFCGFFHLAEDEGRDLAWGVFLTLGFDPCVAVAAVDDVERHVLFVFGQIRIVVAAADQALDAKDCVFGVGDRLAFRRLADKAFIVGEGDDRRRGARAFGVFDHTRLAAIHDGDTAVGGAKVNTDYFGHVSIPL